MRSPQKWLICRENEPFRRGLRGFFLGSAQTVAAYQPSAEYPLNGDRGSANENDPQIVRWGS